MRKTRKVIVADLLARLERGPHLADITRQDALVPAADAEFRTRNWLATWILPDLETPIPEVRQAVRAREEAARALRRAAEGSKP